MGGGNLADKLRLRVFARVAVIQTALVGENHQRVGIHQIGHQRAKRVVVAQLDFGGGYGVVFVNHGHDILRQQRLQRAARVQIARAVAQIFVREQDLRGVEPVRGKRVFIGLRDAHLPHRRRGLQFV